MGVEDSATLETGAEKYQAVAAGTYQVDLSGAFGTIEMRSRDGTFIRSESAAAVFESSAPNPRFELTVGAGPVEVALTQIPVQPDIGTGTVTAA